jgi:hypothetical protein
VLQFRTGMCSSSEQANAPVLNRQMIQFWTRQMLPLRTGKFSSSELEKSFRWGQASAPVQNRQIIQFRTRTRQMLPLRTGK